MPLSTTLTLMTALGGHGVTGVNVSTVLLRLATTVPVTALPLVGVTERVALPTLVTLTGPLSWTAILALTATSVVPSAGLIETTVGGETIGPAPVVKVAYVVSP